jgi:hypothetical protein
VDKPAEAGYTLYATSSFELVVGQVGDRNLEVDPAVRALAVIVLDELAKDAVGLALAADEHPVQALGPCWAHKSFCERVRPRRPNGCLDNSSAGRAEYFVKGPDELGVPIADQEADGSGLVFEGRCEVPGLLGDPRSDGVGCHAAQEYHAALQVDKEQHIDPSEHERVHVEKIARERAGGLGS